MPRRSRQIDSGLLNDQDKLLYAQLNKHAPKETQRFQPRQDSPTGRDEGASDRPRGQHQNVRRFSPLSPPTPLYPDLGLDARSRSLPLLDGSSNREQSHRLSVPERTPPRLSPRPVREANAAPEAGCRGSPEQAGVAAIYHLAGSPGLCETRLWQEEVVYTEVPADAIRNTYEPVEDLRPRQKQAAWGLKVSVS